MFVPFISAMHKSIIFTQIVIEEVKCIEKGVNFDLRGHTDSNKFFLFLYF